MTGNINISECHFKISAWNVRTIEPKRLHNLESVGLLKNKDPRSCGVSPRILPLIFDHNNRGYETVRDPTNFYIGHNSIPSSH